MEAKLKITEYKRHETLSTYTMSIHNNLTDNKSVSAEANTVVSLLEGEQHDKVGYYPILQGSCC